MNTSQVGSNGWMSLQLSSSHNRYVPIIVVSLFGFYIGVYLFRCFYWRLRQKRREIRLLEYEKLRWLWHQKRQQQVICRKWQHKHLVSSPPHRHPCQSLPARNTNDICCCPISSPTSYTMINEKYSYQHNHFSADDNGDCPVSSFDLRVPPMSHYHAHPHGHSQSAKQHLCSFNPPSPPRSSSSTKKAKHKYSFSSSTITLACSCSRREDNGSSPSSPTTIVTNENSNPSSSATPPTPSSPIVSLSSPPSPKSSSPTSSNPIPSSSLPLPVNMRASTSPEVSKKSTNWYLSFYKRARYHVSRKLACWNLYEDKEKKQRMIWKWSVAMGYCHYDHAEIITSIIDQLDPPP